MLEVLRMFIITLRQAQCDNGFNPYVSLSSFALSLSKAYSEPVEEGRLTKKCSKY